MFEKRLVLDTCTILWLASGDKHLSKNTLKAIDQAAMVYVSAISAWEISLKQEKGEIILPMDSEEWFNQVLEQHGLLVAPVDVSIACRANRLPFHHRDPADRLIIATAQELSAAIVTADEKYKEYGIKILI